MAEKAKNSTKIIKGTLQGRFLSFEFFKRNAVYIIAAVIMTLMYISNKYVCQSSIKEMMDLKIQLANAQTDCVNASARYNSMIRESQMKKLVDTMHINLDAPEQPPYKLIDQ